MEVLADFLDSVTTWAWTLNPIQLYLLFAIIAFSENVIPPIPGDLIVVFTGYLAAIGMVDYMPMLVATSIGASFGFVAVYYIARIFGDDIQEQRRDYWLFKYVNKRHYDRVNIWMNYWGQGAIMANRFILGMRTLINVVAGVTRMPVLRSSISATISVIAWNITLMTLGWIIAENWEDVGRYLGYYGRTILVVVSILIISRFVYRKYLRKIIASKK